MENNNNEVMVVGQAPRAIINTTVDATLSYCSIKPKTDEERIELFNILNGDAENGKRIADMINLEIEVQDVAFELVELVDEETGEVTEAPRCILVAPDGTTYNGTTQGILSSIERCIQAFGEPTWKPAKKFVVKQVPTKRGSMLKLVMVTPKKK